MIPAIPEPKIPENGPEPEFRPEFRQNFEPRNEVQNKFSLVGDAALPHTP